MTPAEITALRAACFADPAAAAFFGPGDNQAAGLRGYLNASSGVNAWRTDAPVDAIMDAIDFSKFTPTAGITGADTDPTVSRKVGWCLEVQVKQMNLQMMLQGRQTVNAARPNVRGGLRDAVIQLPTGALDGNGKPGLTSAGGSGGSAVLGACVRVATRAEVMMAAASQARDQTGSVTARVMTWEGEVDEVDSVRLIYKDDGTIWTP